VSANAKLYQIAGHINHNTIHNEAVADNGPSLAGEKKMALSFRRLVTGHNAEGKSALLSDTRIEEGALGNFSLWATRADDADGAEAAPFFPRPGETIFRVVRLPPPDPNMTQGALDALVAEFFAGVGSPACKVDTSRHPLMHVTPTTDYIMLLSGAVSLLLDEGDPVPLKPFDAVVQRATNHAWIVTGAEPAVFLCVMAGAPSQGQRV
jgi:hypothetical protein